MGVQLRVEIARDVVAETGGDDFLPAGAHHLPALSVMHPCLGRVPFDPAERCLHGPVMGMGDALVATHQRGERDGFRGGESEVPAGTVDYVPVLDAAPELLP